MGESSCLKASLRANEEGLNGSSEFLGIAEEGQCLRRDSFRLGRIDYELGDRVIVIVKPQKCSRDYHVTGQNHSR